MAETHEKVFERHEKGREQTCEENLDERHRKTHGNLCKEICAITQEKKYNLHKIEFQVEEPPT